MWLDDQTAVVYRCFDSTGRLIYIGCSGNLPRRTIVHKSSTPWWPRVARITATTTMPLRQARKLEADLIGNLRPPFNKRRNPHWYAAGKPVDFGLDREAVA